MNMNITTPIAGECHEITTRADGTAEFAYAGQKAWHGLGQLVPENATVEEMAVAAGMDWKIERAAVKYATPYAPASAHEVPGRVVLYRSDTSAPLSIVSARFQEVQPRDALEFFRDMTEAGGYTMETAGTMRGGSRMFALVKAAHDFELPGGDLVATRLLFATACDGSMATHVRPTTVRVVCRNTLAMAMARGDTIAVRHSTKFDPNSVKERLQKIDARFDAFAQAAELMARTAVTTKKAESFLESLLPTPLNGLVQDSRAYKQVLALFNGGAKGADLTSSRGTMWGLLNAVTEYVDHHARSSSDENRLESATFGAGDALKSRALDFAVA